MLKRRTTIVVGAGASVDFGLPTGAELIRQILTNLSDRNNNHGSVFGSDSMIKALKYLAAMEQTAWGPYYEAGQKLATLLRGQPVSIDNVVHTHSDDKILSAVAKIGIALSISEGELKGKLSEQHVVDLKSSTRGHGSWLHHFLVRHFSGFTLRDRKNALDKLKFVVFNYDRCTEQLLRQVYANYFHLDDGTAIDEVSTVEIVHPYGFLGQLPSVGYGGEFGYGRANTPKLAFEMSKRLRTFTEGVEDSNLHSKVHSAVSWSDALVFIGFGYIALNRKLLKHEGLRNQSRAVLGSAFGMPPESASLLKREVAFEFNSQSAFGFDPKQDAIGFLREFEYHLFE